MINRKDRITDMAAAAAFVLVLGVACLWGQEVRVPAGAQKAPDPIAGQETGMGIGTASETVKGPVLSDVQGDVIKMLMENLEEDKLEQGARLMEKEEDMLFEMFYETMDGGLYLYDGHELKDDLEGQGIVFTKSNTVYYGTFADGKPEGMCVALQVVNLEAPRYDFSKGMWQNGMMEGEGITGYCYYDGSPQEEARDIRKEGTFSQDLMEGGILYTSVNEDDEKSTWRFDVQNGVIKIDQRWSYMENRGEYQIMAQENDNHAYVAGQEQIGLPMWKNLLAWEF